jgi:hypothetical protein
MAIDIEQELVDAFEAAGSSMRPPADLANLVRRRVNRRRRLLSGAAVVGVAAACGIVIGAASLSSGRSPEKVTTNAPARLHLPVSDVDAMAADANTLYVASGDVPDASLSAYNSVTGRRIGTAHLPSRPNAVAIGPNGDVWVVFYPSNLGGPSGVSEFSADLARDATMNTNDSYLGTANFDVLPTGPNTALMATDRGLVRVRLPRHSHDAAVEANRRNARVDESFATRFGVSTRLAALPDGNVAVLIANDGGGARVVLLHGAGRFEGRSVTMAASPDGLWLTSGSRRVRLTLLNSALVPQSASVAISGDAERSGAVSVWTSGQTVWAETAGPRVELYCFKFIPGEVGHAVRMPLPAGDSAGLSSPEGAGDLTVVPIQHAVYVAGPLGIESYAVPSPCV